MCRPSRQTYTTPYYHLTFTCQTRFSPLEGVSGLPSKSHCGHAPPVWRNHSRNINGVYGWEKLCYQDLLWSKLYRSDRIQVWRSALYNVHCICIIIIPCQGYNTTCFVVQSAIPELFLFTLYTMKHWQISNPVCLYCNILMHVLCR